jgi:hypothetical protein
MVLMEHFWVSASIHLPVVLVEKKSVVFKFVLKSLTQVRQIEFH